MFVLKNAWAALGRVKWRTALTALLALLVSFSAAVDLCGAGGRCGSIRKPAYGTLVGGGIYRDFMFFPV